MASDQVSAGVLNLVPNENSLHNNIQDHFLVALNPVFKDGQLDLPNTNFVSIPKDFRFQPSQEYWLKLSLKCTQSNVPDYCIHLGIHSEINLYRDLQLIGQTGMSINAKNCMHPIHQGWLSLMPLSKKPIDYYFQIKTRRFGSPKAFEASINSLKNLEQIRNIKIKNNIEVYFFRIGVLAIIFFVFVASLIHFLTNSDTTYRCYSFYLLFTFFYLCITFEESSPFNFFIQSHLASYYQALVIPSLMLSYFYYTQFVRCILDTQSKNIRFDKLLRNYGIMTLLFICLDVIFGFIIKVDFYPDLRNGMLIITFFAALFIYFQIWKIKDLISRLVLSGSIIFSIGSFFGFLFTTFISLPKGFGIFSDGLTYMQISVLVEVLFFTVALSYRTMKIEKDKSIANAKLISETYEKERLTYQNNKSKEFELKRSQFFADTNHELRSPLTVIKGMAENLEGNEIQRNFILKNTSNMLNLINNMLDLARAEAGDVPVNLLQDNFNVFCESQIEAWTYFAKTKDIEVSYQSNKKLILMDFDDQKMEQIISNLMSNAIKFTPSGGAVKVTTEEKENEMTLTISDTGTGIEAKDLPNIFDRYYRVESSKTNNDKGTGIGLALVKKLVELLDGKITVSSKFNKGTSFVLHFPITKLAPYSKAKTTLNEKIQSSPNYDLISKKAPINAPELLIVEDNPEILSHLEYSLSESYNINTAIDGSEGIKKASQLFPDLIISDIRMPVQDGLTLCGTLKTDLNTSHIPIILLTAASSDQDKIKGLEKGADAYITKPYSKIELKLRIENLLQVKKTLHAYFSKNIDSETIKRSKISKEDQSFLDQLVNYIKDNIDDLELDVQRMMKAVNVSRPTLHSKLKSLTGCSASQFKKQIKMQEAKRMLQEGHSNISDLAYSLGYKYPNNFSKDFKKWYGIAPNKFGK